MPDDDVAVRIFEEGFAGWMLGFRQMSGRSLTGAEHAMAKAAFATGFETGFTVGTQVMVGDREAASRRRCCRAGGREQGGMMIVEVIVVVGGVLAIGGALLWVYMFARSW